MNRQKYFKQYFTPPVVARFMAENSEARSSLRIIDPSVGDGVFIEAWKNRRFSRFVGIDIDHEVIGELKCIYSKEKKIFLFHCDGLDGTSPDNNARENYFHLAIGNPPFSNQKRKVRDRRILDQYTLGAGRESQSVEILFLERFTKLLKPCGQLRIILPINIFSNTDLRYVREYMARELDVEALTGLPRGIFSNTTARTAVLFARKKARKDRGKLQKNKVRLFQIQDRDNIGELENLSVNMPGTGLMKSINSLLDRMDPEYHYKEKIIKNYLNNGNVGFIQLGRAAVIRNGFTLYGTSKKLIYKSPPATNRIRLIKAKNISPLGFKFEKNAYYISSGEPVFKPRAMAEQGEILFIRVGVGCIGRAVCLYDEEVAGQADDWFFILKTRNLNPYFLAFYLNSTVGKSFIDREKQGTGTVSISKNKLKNVMIPLLNDETQKRFEEKMKRMYSTYGRGHSEEARELFEEMDREILEILNNPT